MVNPYAPPAHDEPFVGGPGVLSEGSYEFSAAENAIIDKTGRRAQAWGVIALILGLLIVASGAIFLFGLSGMQSAFEGLGVQLGALLSGVSVFLVAYGALYLVMGKLYMDAGRALRDVVVTSGNDVEHLMQSLERLVKAFRIESLMTGVAVVLVVGAQLLGVAISGMGV